jgi:dTDP-4-dehydrorhamnose 3,5-epimerase-like enzyme
MGLSKQIELRPLESIKGGMAEFYTPQKSHETMLVQVPANTIDDLFVHRHQTDQILVVRGSFVLVILQNRRYEYVLLNEDSPMVVQIPPGVLHGAINLTGKPCTIVNAVIRHGEPLPRDYVPMARPLPYDLDRARNLVASLEYYI